MPPERPDPRHVGNQIRDALVSYDKDALAEILTHVFKEYVVEGPPPLVPSRPDRLEELQGLSFAEVIAALQARLDLPELAFFEIEGSRVGVKVGGRTQWLDRSEAPRAPDVPAPNPNPSPPSGEPARRAPTPGVSVVETTLAQRPQASPPPAVAASAPRPARGLSVSSAPGGTHSAQTAQPAQPSQPAAPRPAQPAKAEEPPSGASDDAAARFKLLEVD